MSINLRIERNDSEHSHVEISCFNDPESGVWGMTYKLHCPEANVAETPNNTTKKLKRKRDHLTNQSGVCDYGKDVIKPMNGPEYPYAEAH